VEILQNQSSVKVIEFLGVICRGRDTKLLFNNIVLTRAEPSTHFTLAVFLKVALLIALSGSLGQGEEAKPGLQKLVLEAIEEADIPPHLKTQLKRNVEKDKLSDEVARECTWSCSSENLIGVAASAEYSEKTKRTAVTVSQLHFYAGLALASIDQVFKGTSELTDRQLLRHALLRGDEECAFFGKVQGMLYRTITQENLAITVGYCPIQSIEAELLKPANFKDIRVAYSSAGHSRLRDATRTKNWLSADDTWEHLKQLDLLTPQLVIDYGDCLLRQNKSNEAIKHFDKYLAGYGHIIDKSYFIQIVDLLEPLSTTKIDAERIALQAYEKYERLLFPQLRKTKSPTPLSIRNK